VGCGRGSGVPGLKLWVWGKLVILERIGGPAIAHPNGIGEETHKNIYILRTSFVDEKNRTT
jgi:hypothetical protein